MAYNPWYPQQAPPQPTLFGTPGYVAWFPTGHATSPGLVSPNNPHWGGQAYTDAYNGAAPVAANRSEKYPDLNPILAIDTTKLRFDIKHHPQSEILASTWYGYRTSPAKAPQHGGHATSYMRLISHKFPWSIDIKLPPGTNITCGIVWEAIYHALQQPLEDSEWGMIVMDRKARERVEGAMKKRMEAAPSSPPGPKRIDYLGDSTLFKGLEKDGEFIKLRTMPGEGVAPETWVLKITS
ncbi:hypothetical protein BKA70DRAFT_1231465 [Coprinopsis sp. MPI-PUGE-AT-0042]|nr:hypothetical protein BKA70DRAFT_1231465 [Coprinopsis sp. MPI-PUGE-AT-0042]